MGHLKVYELLSSSLPYSYSVSSSASVSSYHSSLEQQPDTYLPAFSPHERYSYLRGTFLLFLSSFSLLTPDSLYQSCAILGGTIMPHTIYLGSGLVQARLRDFDIVHSSYHESPTSSNPSVSQKLYRPSLSAIKACLNYSIAELVRAIHFLQHSIKPELYVSEHILRARIQKLKTIKLTDTATITVHNPFPRSHLHQLLHPNNLGLLPLSGSRKR